MASNIELGSDDHPNANCDDGSQGLWVFGYGSLMWRPGFEFEERQIGLCAGVHRSMCIWSVHHRGSVKSPGLVLGLESGGVCSGTVFYVPPSIACSTLQYLRRREQVTRVYREVYRQVDLMDGSHRRVRALCFVANREHAQFVNGMSLVRQADIVKRSHGQSGHNLDYLASTVQHLNEMNIKDDLLRRILVLTNCGHKLRR